MSICLAWMQITMVPYLVDNPNIGYVQARWVFTNPEESYLTKVPFIFPWLLLPLCRTAFVDCFPAEILFWKKFADLASFDHGLDWTDFIYPEVRCAAEGQASCQDVEVPRYLSECESPTLKNWSSSSGNIQLA
jgi:hypothetical protein